MTKPNVLLIITDQQNFDALSCAGNNDLHTPAMDGLANDGVRFQDAYCTYPLCTPSRASMFTGLMPSTLGITGNDVELPAETEELELGSLMRDAGYDTVYLGKWHVPEIAMPDGLHGFRTLAGFDDNAIVPAARRYFTEHGAGATEQPFFMVASFDNPHNICEWARTQPLPWGEIEERPPAECPNLPANFAVPPYEPEVIRRVIAAMPKVYFSGDNDRPDLWRQHRNAYFRLVEKVDNQIGQLLDGLKAAGTYADTLVIFLSDHGDGNGAHHWRQKLVLYQEAVKVPLIIKPPASATGTVDPDGPTRGVERAHLASIGLDLLPTICDYAGIAPPDRAQGESLRPAIEQADADFPRDAVFVETSLYADRQNSADGRLVRTADYTYIAYSWGRPREQLFHIQTDPGEMVNLAVEQRYAGVLQEHRDILLRHLTEIDDAFATHYAHPGVATVPGLRLA